MQRLAASPKSKRANETVLAKVDFTLYGLDIDAGELLSGTPELDVPDGITCGTPLINTLTFKNTRGRVVAVGRGIIFSISGGTAGESYIIGVSCVTNSTPAQTLEGACPIDIVEDD